MITDSFSFEYDPKNLDSLQLNLFSGSYDMTLLIFVGICAIIGMVIYFMMPFLIGMYFVNAETRKKESNRKRIRELILMKEVQGELEKEIEESMINDGLKLASAS